jgi:DNA polymerase-3 subunit epsilon
LYLFYDTETTGFCDFKLPPEHPKQPHLVQLGAIMTDLQGRVLNSIDLIIYPDGWEIPPEASRVHGITTDMAKSYGVPRRIALATFNHLYKNAKAVMAHNHDFDYLVMQAQYTQEGVPHRMDGVPRHCTMKSATPHTKIPKPGGGGFKWPTLSEAHIHYCGKDFDNKHQAIADTIALVNIFFPMKKAGHIVTWPESNVK